MNTLDILALVGIPSILSFLFQIGFKTYQDRRKQESETEKWKRLGVQALLRDRLQQGYRYFTAQGHISLADKENYNNLYNCYEHLGENGVMAECHKEVMELEVK